jgi:hypothetical protein
VLVEEMIYANKKVCHYYKKILRDFKGLEGTNLSWVSFSKDKGNVP